MIFYGIVVVLGFAGGYLLAAGYGGQAAAAVGSAVKNAQLDALGLLDDSPASPASDPNGSFAGNP